MKTCIVKVEVEELKCPAQNLELEILLWKAFLEKRRQKGNNSILMHMVLEWDGQYLDVHTHTILAIKCSAKAYLYHQIHQTTILY